MKYHVIGMDYVIIRKDVNAILDIQEKIVRMNKLYVNLQKNHAPDRVNVPIKDVSVNLDFLV